MSSFTPVPSLLGGILIGLAAGLLWLSGGQIAGISGILGSLLSRWGQATLWRVAFLAGMLGTALWLQAVWPEAFALAGLPGLGMTALSGLAGGGGHAARQRLHERAWRLRHCSRLRALRSQPR
jgi:hypothetical protein